MDLDDALQTFILESRELVKFFCPDTGDQPHGTKHRCAKESKNSYPPGSHEMQISKPGGDDEDTCTNGNTAQDGCQYIGTKNFPMR